MAKIIAAYIALFVFISCAKEINNDPPPIIQLPPPPPPQIDTPAVLDTAIIPLNDLGINTYRGYPGGLYPGGANEPSGQYAADLIETSKSVKALDQQGKPAADGKIVFISLGASTGGKNMKALKAKTTDNPETNSRLLLLNCNTGAGHASLNSIMDPNDEYWLHVNQVIQRNTSYDQVQIIYLETEDSALATWPEKSRVVSDNIHSCLRIFKQKFPNIKLVYVLGRTRTFPNVKLWNREPSPYYFGWACKWAIEDQINGVPGTEYKGSNAVAPMITWGFYQWADSLPRKTDDFSWRFSQTSDGLHATEEGQDTLATRFQYFLLTDRYASIWYAKH